MARFPYDEIFIVELMRNFSIIQLTTKEVKRIAHEKNNNMQ